MRNAWRRTAPGPLVCDGASSSDARMYVHMYIGRRCMPRSSFTRILSRTRAGTRIQLSALHCPTRIYTHVPCNEKTFGVKTSSIFPRDDVRQGGGKKETGSDGRGRKVKNGEIEEKGSEKKRVRRVGWGKKVEKERRILSSSLCCRQLWGNDRVTNARHFISNGIPPIIVDPRLNCKEHRRKVEYERTSTAASRSCEPRIRPLLQTSTRRQGYLLVPLLIR